MLSIFCQNFLSRLNAYITLILMEIMHFCLETTIREILIFKKSTHGKTVFSKLLTCKFSSEDERSANLGLKLPCKA